MIQSRRSNLAGATIAGILAAAVPLATPFASVSAAAAAASSRGSPAYTPPARLAANSSPARPPLQIRIGPHAGWERCWTLDNGETEALIVPAIGRILQFRRIDQPGPFWHDPALHGRSPDPASTEWLNFGGDKSWPAPQSDWATLTARAWPPPGAFDAAPVEMSVRREGVVMRSPVDPHFGIQTERVVRLEPGRPVMTVVTTYEKTAGNPVTVGVWIITQLDHPVAVFALLPETSRFEHGYDRQSGDALPADLTIEGRLLSLARDPDRSTKIGTDAERLLWVGEHQMLLIESPRIPGVPYPDRGSSAEIYTNPNPRTYVELEMLGPLRTLAVGDSLSQTNTYTLIPRRSEDPRRDAARVLLETPKPAPARPSASARRTPGFP